MLINQKLGDVIGNEIKKQGKSYENIAKLASVSKTYLTDIIVKGKIPSIEIINNICSALNIDPATLKEYRVLLIQDKLSKDYFFLTLEQIEKLDDILKIDLDLKTSKEKTKFSERTYRLEEGINWMDLSDLTREEKQFMINMKKELKSIFKNTGRNNN